VPYRKAAKSGDIFLSSFVVILKRAKFKQKWQMVSFSPVFLFADANLFLRKIAVFMFVLVAAAAPLHAGNDDSGGGFFSYLPAAPKLHLPSINIVPFWTDDFKTAKRAYNNQRYGKALQYFNKASDDGNIIADWYLGHMYRLGRGVAADQAVAYSYYSRVAENFDPEEQDQDRLRVTVDSQLRIATYLRVGIAQAHLKANPQLAARTFLRLATTYAHPSALFALGAMSIEGEGMKQNPQQGLKWLNAAVRKHSPEAAAYLGDLYSHGNVVKLDETRALMWYIIAAQNAPTDEFPFIPAKLDELRAGATEETRIEAEARARVWLDENPAQ
jgi:uncharacterized protein